MTNKPMKTTANILRASFALACLALLPTTHASSVTYTMQTANFNATGVSGGGFQGYFDNSGTEIGVYANSAGDSSFAAFQTFTTSGAGGGTARALQAGDTFTLTAYIVANPPSRIGLAFRSSTTYSSFSQIDIADEAKFQLDSSGGWKIYNSGSAIDSGNGANADATLTIKVTSAKTFNATVVLSGNTFNTYDVPMITGGGAAITSFGVFAVNSGNNTFWKNGSLSDTGTVEFGTGNGTSTVSGLIADGLAADSTSTVRTNALVKNGTGAITLSNSGNTYGGGTTINAGTLSISSDGNLGTATGGVAISGGSSSVLAISSSLTLNSSRTITIGSSGAKLDAGANTLTIAGPIVNNSGNNHLFILAAGNTALNGNATGTGDIVKQGAGTLTLNGSANTFGTTTANIYIDNGGVQGASSAAFGQTSSGGGALTMGADTSGNNGATTILLTSGGASVTNAINARYYAGFNASKTVGGNNASGTAAYYGNITLNDNLNLTAASGGGVTFNGVIQQGTATGGQSVNGTPGIVKVGLGTVTLAGVNTYSGTTTVSNGTLVINGTNGTGALTVTTNGTLNGNGLIKGATTIQLGGTLSPTGTFPTTLTVSNSLTLAGNGNFRIGTGQTADKIAGVSTCTSGGTLNITLNSGSLTGGEIFTLVQATSYGGSAPAAGTMPSLSSGQNWYLGSLAVNGTIAVNRAPSAQNISLGAQAGVLQTLPITTSTKHAPTDPDSDTLSLAAITQGTNGGVVTISGGNVTYSNSVTGADSFTYTVSDGRGGTSAAATVIVTVTPVVNQQTAQLSFNGSGNAVLVFWGVPGTSYTIQKSSNLTTWSDLTTLSANNTNTQPYGRISYTDTGTPSGTAGYYRLKP